MRVSKECKMINLSIIIPHYNSINTLQYLLESIPNYKDIEVIVIDDHSNAESKKELIEIGKKKSTNIKFLNNEPHKIGAGACRNIGLDKASGKWLLFADADD